VVQGFGTFAGGITSRAGTSKAAVTSAPSGGGVLSPVVGTGGNGTRPTEPALSKPARPVGGDWDCKALFPHEAAVDDATVLIVARVRPDGTPESVSIVKDPGQGFGRAARACAMSQRYAAAEDYEGHSVLATTAPFRVRFTR
jgi:protein TonB